MVVRALCVRLFQEHGIAVATGGGFQVRAFDATTVKEPGKTGTLWRIHLFSDNQDENAATIKMRTRE